MRHFVTLFDSHYLARALVMYRSLERTGEDFRLYAICFDGLAYDVLHKLALPRLEAIPLQAVETPQLLAVKGSRTVGEYCWTCTPHVIRHVLDSRNLPEVTYLDADLYFYARPSVLFAEYEASGASVLITEHRYTPRYDQSATSGIYCVQFMTFKADQRGMQALQWWQDRCLEWCYARFEEGKFGDQKYLDDWPRRFEGIHVLQHLGGGVAPWNVQQYSLQRDRGGSLSVDGVPLVFFHLHGYRHYADGTHSLGSYRLSRRVIAFIYRPYVRQLQQVQAELAAVHPGFDPGRIPRPHSWKTAWLVVRRLLNDQFNEYRNL